MTSLNKQDYIKILNYYDINIPKSYIKIKKIAETVLANKLCRCIKKVSSVKDETKGIGICTRSIFNKKGLKRGTFKCKKNIKRVTFKKKHKNNTMKKAKKGKLSTKTKTIKKKN